jgi:hypothetical protein
MGQLVEARAQVMEFSSGGNSESEMLPDHHTHSLILSLAKSTHVTFLGQLLPDSGSLLTWPLTLDNGYIHSNHGPGPEPFPPQVVPVMTNPPSCNWKTRFLCLMLERAECSNLKSSNEEARDRVVFHSC